MGDFTFFPSFNRGSFGSRGFSDVKAPEPERPPGLQTQKDLTDGSSQREHTMTNKLSIQKDWLRQGMSENKRLRGMSQSTQSLLHALSFLSEIGQRGGKALFIGDRPEHGLFFHEYLRKTPHSYLSCGWVPGLITNASQHECSQQAHHALARILQERPRALRGRAAKIFESRQHVYANIRDLKPDVIIFLGEEDHRSGCLQECQKLHIPTVALCPAKGTLLWSSRVTYPVFFQTSIQTVHKFTKLFQKALCGDVSKYTQRSTRI